jgi:4-amino-4-deoxy-L-arabinose transferase-like glycosyltransferase
MMIRFDKVVWAHWATVVLGVALVLPGLSEVPFTQGDDATYYSTAQSLVLLIDWSGENWAAISEGRANMEALRDSYDEEGVAFVLPYYSKPLFDFIYWSSVSLWGVTQQAILYANLIFFALTIWCMARVGEALFGRETGLFAALFIATSGSALVYARTGMAHMASLAFFMLGAHLYLRFCLQAQVGESRRLLLPGSMWGICLAIHPNLLPFIGLCGIAEMARSWSFLGAVGALRRAIWIASGALIVALVIEGVYLIIGAFYGDVLTSATPWLLIPFRTYFEQIAIHANAVMDGGVTPLQKFYTYFLLFWAHEGLLTCVLIGLLTFSQFRGRCDYKTLVLLVLFWVPLLFFFLSKNQAVYRYAAGCALPAALLAAVALERLLLFLSPKRFRFSTGIRAAAVFAVVAVNFSHIRPIYEVESAWASTAHWLRLHGQKQVVSSVGGNMWALNGIDNISPQDLSGGVRYLALYRRYEKEDERKIIQRYSVSRQPVFTALHRRPDKLLEVSFLANNLIFDGLGLLPGIGNYIADMRNKALHMNSLHLMEVYELSGANDKMGSRSEQGNSTGSAKEIGHVG